MKSRNKLLLGILFCLLFFPLKNVYGASTDYALKFSSNANFTLKANSGKTWDGTIEYSLNNGSTWTTWTGSQLSGTATQPIYIRGTGNTVITGNDSANKWVMTGSNVECHGNIENLLDYQKVANNEHPTMAEGCYGAMFKGCTSLTTAPELPATTLTASCYYSMFQGCTSLTQAPKLPATKLADCCYFMMFSDCTSLEQVPELPAIILAYACYGYMFKGCTSLMTAPTLPATTLTVGCYQGMFKGCTSLEQVPNLPATTLAEYCYANMFEGCTSLKQAPKLPATELAAFCYNSMFKGCTSLEQAPNVPATTLTKQCYASMFEGCTSLEVSDTQTDEYRYAYRVPTIGTGTDATDALKDMFANTGGTFTGTPEPNKTYYVNFRTESAAQTVELTPTLLEIEKKDNIPNTSLDDRDKKSACEVIANVYYAYYVSMPATLTLSPSESENNVYVSDYKVKAKTKTDGLSGKYIKVSPEHSIDLTNENNGNTVSLTIEQDKEYFGENDSSNVVKVSADKWVETKGRVHSTITQQGNYKGNFKFEYGLVDSIE